MKVILLEKVYNLGELGDQVDVKPGYARNFLLPQGKALRATKSNVAYFEDQRKALEKKNAEDRKEAEKQAKKLDGTDIIIVRQAAESGKLYGSVSSRDIATDTTEQTGVTVDRTHVNLNRAVKTLGLFPVPIQLHPEVSVEITINVARSEEEAKIQKEKGGALIVEPGETLEEAKADALEEEITADTNVEELFEKKEDAEAALKGDDADKDAEENKETAKKEEETAEETEEEKTA